MNSPLSYIKGIFVSSMNHWGMGKNAKRVWKVPAENRGTQRNSIQRQACSWQTEVFGHRHTTAQLQQQAISSPPVPRSSWAPHGQPVPLPCSRWGSRAAPQGGRWQQGTVAVPRPWELGRGLWGWGAGEVAVLALQVTCFQCLMLDWVNINQMATSWKFYKTPGVCWSQKVKRALSAGAVQPFHPLSS